MEKKRATSLSPNTRKMPSVSSPPNSPKLLPKITTERISIIPKSSTTALDYLT